MPSSLEGTRKTKAHRTLAEAIASGDQVDHQNNSIVDGIAKEYAYHLSPPKLKVESIQHELAQRMKILKGAARLLALFQLFSQLELPAKGKPTKPKSKLGQRSGHRLVWSGGRWVCQVCLKPFLSQLSGQRSSCSGQPSLMQATVKEALSNGHCL